VTGTGISKWADGCDVLAARPPLDGVQCALSLPVPSPLYVSVGFVAVLVKPCTTHVVIIANLQTPFTRALLSPPHFRSFTPCGYAPNVLRYVRALGRLELKILFRTPLSVFKGGDIAKRGLDFSKPRVLICSFQPNYSAYADQLHGFAKRPDQRTFPDSITLSPLVGLCLRFVQIYGSSRLRL